MFQPPGFQTTWHRPLLRRTLLLLMLSGAPMAAAAGDLMEAADQAGSFKGFIAAAKKTGVDELLHGKGPYTVFAPTDEAIARYGNERWKELGQDRERMAQLLKQHVLRGKTLITEVKPGPAETLAGTKIPLKSDNGLVKVGTANVTQSDIHADNGVIHAIDEVLRVD